MPSIPSISGYRYKERYAGVHQYHSIQDKFGIRVDRNRVDTDENQYCAHHAHT